MAFTDEAIRAKLSSLNETQDSIAGVSQWIMFHRRHADRTAQIWMQKIKESTPNKKLSLIYLSNEIVQQSKIRKKDEFVKAYDPIIVEATTAAYKGSSSDVQGKIRRVVEVWRQRQVFRPAVQEQIEASLDDIDRTRSTRKPALGGSLFSNSTVPPELASVAPLATTLQKADVNAKPAISAAGHDYEKLTNPNNPIPTPPTHAAHLAALVKKLATAEVAVAESIKARQSLIVGLEKLLHTNKAKLSADEAQVAELSSRRDAIETRKRQVEEAILKGLSAAETKAISAAPLSVKNNGRSTATITPERPDIEELTPPPMESFTPIGSPQLEAQTEAQLNPIPDDVFPDPVSHPISPPSAVAPNSTSIPPPILPDLSAGLGADLLSSLTAHTRQIDEALNGIAGHGPGGTSKKRKMSRSTAEDEFAAFEGDGDLDAFDANLGNMI